MAPHGYRCTQGNLAIQRDPDAEYKIAVAGTYEFIER